MCVPLASFIMRVCAHRRERNPKTRSIDTPIPPAAQPKIAVSGSLFDSGCTDMWVGIRIVEVGRYTAALGSVASESSVALSSIVYKAKSKRIREDISDCTETLKVCCSLERPKVEKTRAR